MYTQEISLAKRIDIHMQSGKATVVAKELKYLHVAVKHTTWVFANTL